MSSGYLTFQISAEGGEYKRWVTVEYEGNIHDEADLAKRIAARNLRLLSNGKAKFVEQGTRYLPMQPVDAKSVILDGRKFWVGPVIQAESALPQPRWGRWFRR